MVTNQRSEWGSMATVQATVLQDQRIHADEDGEPGKRTTGWVREKQVIQVGGDVINGYRRFGETGWLLGGPEFLEIESVTPPVHTCPAGQHWDDVQNRCVPDVVIVPPPPPPPPPPVPGATDTLHVWASYRAVVYDDVFKRHVLGVIESDPTFEHPVIVGAHDDTYFYHWRQIVGGDVPQGLIGGWVIESQPKRDRLVHKPSEVMV